MKTIKVGGMSCQHCVNSVTKALEAVPGVSEVSVSLEKGEAQFEAQGVDMAEVKKAIEKIGFTAEV